MQVLPIDLDKFLAVHKSMLHVKYGLGAKAVPLTKPASQIKAIDCSGYVRYLTYHATGGFQIKDGSWHQREQFEDFKLDRVSYKEAMGLKDTLVIACYTANTNGVGSVGHILFGLNGKTYESYSGNGVGSKPMDNPWRKNHVHKVFVYPTKNRVKSPVPFILYQSNGQEIAALPVFGGKSYVPARSWAAWHNIPFHWDAATGVYFHGKPLVVEGKPVENRLIEGVTYIPFTAAAEYSGVGYAVSNEDRKIILQPRSSP